MLKGDITEYCQSMTLLLMAGYHSTCIKSNILIGLW